jgi:hypothetical protein
MTLTNSEKLIIIQQIAKLVEEKSLIKADKKYNLDDFGECWEFLTELREKRCYTLSNKKKYLWCFYIGDMFVFQTPPYSDNYNDKFRSKLESFIEETRANLDEFIAQNHANPKLDLRGNTGGYIYAYINTLLPFWRIDKKTKLLSGIGRFGGLSMELHAEPDKMELRIISPIAPEYSVTDKLIPANAQVEGQLTILANSRTASSAEIVAISLRDLVGAQIVTSGPNTMGLTTGMLTENHKTFNVSMPCYWFQDSSGTIYKNGVIFVESLPNLANSGNYPNSKDLYNYQVLTEQIPYIPSELRKYAFSHNNVCDLVFDNNYHFAIHYIDKYPKLECLARPEYIYIYVPPKCRCDLATELNKHKKALLMGGVRIIIDIRNSKLKGVKSAKVFARLLQPCQIGKYHVSAQHPYITGGRTMVSGSYSGAKMEIWVNKNSIHGDAHSTVLAAYLEKTYKICGQFGQYYGHILEPYEVGGAKVECFSGKLI